MNKRTVLLAGLGVVLLGAVFLVLKPNPTPMEQVEGMQNNNTEQNSAPISGTFSGSMRDLVAKKQSVKCTFTHKTDIDSSSGTVFVSDGKVRGDFAILVPQSSTSFEAHMIADGDFTYVWSSLLPQGFKMPIANTSMQASSQPTSGVDYNQALDYTCESWRVDASVFVTPANISFVSAPTKTN